MRSAAIFPSSKSTTTASASSTTRPVRATPGRMKSTSMSCVNRTINSSGSPLPGFDGVGVATGTEDDAGRRAGDLGALHDFGAVHEHVVDPHRPAVQPPRASGHVVAPLDRTGAD